MDNDVIELTELHDLDVTRQDGVENPASGFSFIIQKSKKVKDFSGDTTAEQAAWEAAEGDPTDPHSVDDGSVDVPEDAETTMPRMSSCMACGSSHCEVGKDHREFHQDERKRLAKKGHALPDGSYPIPDADALRRAAILARSGHGDVKAAKALIARRAKELGVPNPLTTTQKEAEMPSEDPTVIDETAEKAAEVVDTAPEVSEAPEDIPEVAEKEVLTREVVDEMIAKAVAEVLQKSESKAEAENANLRAELEVLKATPIPGGPSLLPSAEAAVTKVKSEALAKAAHYRARAEAWKHDPQLAEQYLELAKSAESAAN